MNEIQSLQERAKELRCFYQVQEVVSNKSLSLPSVFLRVVEVIPDGWQFPSQTGARIEYLGRSYVGPGYSKEGERLLAPIKLGNTELGYIEVVLASGAFIEKQIEQAFLPEEKQLLSAIANRLSEYLEWKHTQMIGERIPSNFEHWRWREEYAEALCEYLDWDRLGVKRIFIGGSTENGQAGHGSDIDLFIEFEGSSNQKKALTTWLDGWGCCLSEVAYRKTGYRLSENIIDIHWIDNKSDPRLFHGYRELIRKRK
ncbi:MAG: nucleotidyltransferase domain-containing protein [Ignavibacteria bacterium]|jgi:hypothetical protein